MADYATLLIAFVLVKFVVETQFEDIPADVIQRARGYILDNLASGLIGSAQPWSKMVAELVREARSVEECTVFGQKWRTNPSGAALVNGTSLGAFETDGGYPPGSVHPGTGVFPALFAIAEQRHKDGKSLHRP